MQIKLKHLFLVLSLSFIVTTASIAQVKVAGKVIDIVGRPIPKANIILLNKSTLIGKMFIRTDESGTFSFQIPDSLNNERFLLKITAIGHQSKNILISNQLNNQPITLEEDIIRLKEVNIKSNRPFIQKNNDTLSYIASQFMTGADRTVEDVLKNIPGIEVTKAGQISFNGRPISSFYIDGDNILGDRYNIATRNLTGNLINKIQVIQNDQPIKVLQGVLNTDNVAINLTLKDEAKLKFINSAMLGAGIEDLYQLQVNSIAFKPRLKTINLLKLNNSGVDYSQEIASFFDSNDFRNGPNLNIGTTTAPNIDKAILQQ